LTRNVAADNESFKTLSTTSHGNVPAAQYKAKHPSEVSVAAPVVVCSTLCLVFQSPPTAGLPAQHRAELLSSSSATQKHRSVPQKPEARPLVSLSSELGKLLVVKVCGIFSHSWKLLNLRVVPVSRSGVYKVMEVGNGW
jgi:hypothetical protein